MINQYLIKCLFSEKIYKQEDGSTMIQEIDNKELIKDGLIQHCWTYDPIFDQVKNICFWDICYLTEKFESILLKKDKKEYLFTKSVLKSQYKIYTTVFKNESISVLDYISVTRNNVYESFIQKMFQLMKQYKTHLCIPEDYEIRLKSVKLINKLNQYKLNLVEDQRNNQIKYTLFGTSKLGRFSTKANSFPILSLKKEKRGNIIPNNDLFLELDYNAVDLRCLLGIANIEQPQSDLHDWLNQTYFPDLSRQEYKSEIFKSLYSSNQTELLPIDFEKIKSLYYRDGKVFTPYSKELECEEKLYLSYLLQSTSSSIFVDRVSLLLEEINKLNLSGIDVAFTLHDSVTFDIKNEYIEMLVKLGTEILSNTILGKFKINIKIGKNYGDMNKYE